ncbi:glycosyltransferase family 4 protein [Bdellovibrio bacteriovorus]|uniref:glycosyltransferase family 4 protein n=1 Tax=Bdellovibrio bacteriovorus TaxID=959 RepID=UPI0035A6C103
MDFFVQKDKRITVFYLISTLRRCGATAVLYNTVAGLDKAIRPVVITIAPEDADSMRSAFEDILGCKVIQIGSRGWYSVPGIVYRLLRMSRKEEFAVVHAHGLRPDFIAAILSFFNVRSVSTIHSNFFLDYPFKYGPLIGEILSFAHSIFVSLIGSPVAVSTSLEQVFRSQGLQKVRCILNGIDLNRFLGFRRVDEQKRNAVAFGRIVNLKRFDVISKAFQEATKGSKEQLHIYGEGPMLDALKDLALENVVFFGNEKNIERVLPQYKVFISASETEALPNAVVEALCSGAKVILSDIPPHREIHRIAGEKCPIYFFPVNDVDALRTLIKRALDEPQKSCPVSDLDYFSSARMSKEYSDLYKSLFEED